MRRTMGRVVLLAGLISLTGCSALSSSQTVTKAKTFTPGTSPTPTPQPLPTLAQGAWKAVGSKVSGVPATYLANTDSGKIAYLWLDSHLLHFRLIPGTKVPERSPVRPIDNLRSSWLPKIAAAFNGGFWLRDLHFGGYFYDGTVVRTLVAGQSALVIDKSGHLQVGMWGREFTSTKNLMVVRENMKISHRQLSRHEQSTGAKTKEFVNTSNQIGESLSSRSNGRRIARL